VSRGPARAIGPGQRVPAQARGLALGAGVGAEAVAVRGRAASLLAVAGDRDLPFRSRATGIPALLIAFSPRSSSRRRRGRRRPSVPPARVYIRRRIVVCVCVSARGVGSATAKSWSAWRSNKGHYEGGRTGFFFCLKLRDFGYQAWDRGFHSAFGFWEFCSAGGFVDCGGSSCGRSRSTHAWT
jgi:hypothetical protein